MPGKFSFSDPELQRVQSVYLEEKGIRLSVLRLDRIHPEINGNKWFKLQQNIDAIQKSGKDLVLSFGGAWSNHLMALAAAGRYFGFRTVGVVRGELPNQSNASLDFMQHHGMTLHSVSRTDYRKKTDPEFIASLRGNFGDFYLLPEGGSNELAVSGCREISSYLHWDQRASARLVTLACGTGATMAGVILGLEAGPNWQAEVFGVSVLKAPGYMHRQVDHWLQRFNSKGKVSWSVSDAYHCGGYARRNDELDAFLRCLPQSMSLPLEPVYTGKLALGLYGEIQRGAITAGTDIIALHTGGLPPEQ